MAGASSPQLQTEAAMIKAIRESGRTPVQRDTFYRPVKVWEGAVGMGGGHDQPAGTPAPQLVTV
jgi:hypothetical protein